MTGSNHGPLADELFDLRQEEREIAERIAEVRAEILKTGRASIEGRRAVVTVQSRDRFSFDVDKVKTFLTVEQFKSCSRQISFQLVKAVARPRARAKVVAA